MKLVDYDQFNTKGFEFSAVRTETLGAPEYTLVTLVLDKTGSVSSFASELFSIRSTVVEACKKSPRSDYLLLRYVEFNSKIDEVHGFTPLTNLDPATYCAPVCGGSTALNDAVFSAVSASNLYGKTLTDQDFLVNSIIIVVTDGDDNCSRMVPADIKAELAKAVSGEYLESTRTILVGVNASAYTKYLQSFKNEVGMDQYEDISAITPAKLAKLADFISRSISAQSQSLGTGGPSQALVF